MESSNDLELLQKAYNYLKLGADDIGTISQERVAPTRTFFPLSCQVKCERVVKIRSTRPRSRVEL